MSKLVRLSGIGENSSAIAFDWIGGTDLEGVYGVHSNFEFTKLGIPKPKKGDKVLIDVTIGDKSINGEYTLGDQLFHGAYNDSMFDIYIPGKTGSISASGTFTIVSKAISSNNKILLIAASVGLGGVMIFWNDIKKAFKK